MTKKHLFIVDTISTFRMRYAIEAESLEHAYDEVTMKGSGNKKDEFDEISQKHLGEQIIDGREISHTDLDSLVKQMNNDKVEISVSVTNVDRFIRRINYGNC